MKKDKVITEINNTLLKKEFIIVFRVFIVSLLFSLVFLSINFLKVNKLKSIYKTNKIHWIDKKKNEICANNKSINVKYNKDMLIYNNNLQQYFKDSSDYFPKYKQYEELKKISDTNYKKYEISHKRWVNKLNYKNRNKYDSIIKRRDDINNKNSINIRGISKDYLRSNYVYYNSGDEQKDDNWLIKMGEPQMNFLMPNEPFTPVKPIKQSKPVIINKFVVSFPTYDHFIITELGFWNISLERELNKNILPIVLLSFLATLIIRYLILFLFFLYKRIKRLIDFINSINIKKLYVKIIYNMNYKKIRLIIGIYISVCILIIGLFYINRDFKSGFTRYSIAGYERLKINYLDNTYFYYSIILSLSIGILLYTILIFLQDKNANK